MKYLHPADHNPREITKADKDFSKIPDFKDIKFPIKIGDIHKIEKRILSPLALLNVITGKNIQPMYLKYVVKKTC